MPPRTRWEGSLHQSFRLLPGERRSGNLEVFLSAQGATPDDVLSRLPYDAARSATPGKQPDPKRYRDGKQVYQTMGLLYEGAAGRLVVTDLGVATRRWLDRLNPNNAPVLGRHCASALAACQLRNPTGAGSAYDKSVEVFPFAFIWRAMLDLDCRIDSDELNRAVFKVNSEDDLHEAIGLIQNSRGAEDPTLLGDETIGGEKKNDRIIPWIAIASFGWMLMSDKREDPEGRWYRIRPNCLALVREASRIRHEHREFSDVPSYVEHVARAAALPRDLR